MQRQVFFISDRTGITAETLGHGLLSQFPQLRQTRQTFRYVDSIDKAKETLASILQMASGKDKPIVISTVIADELREAFAHPDIFLLDLFAAFIKPLEHELGVESSHKVGHSHGCVDDVNYAQRIEAINYTMAHDDGLNTRNYERAPLILVGVSRSGKTPSSLYLAMQYGLSVANYPLTEEDFDNDNLPKVLQPYKQKLYGLTISAQRLSQIRSERLPNSHYASLRQCQSELASAEMMFRKYSIPVLDVTQMSVEEISTTLIDARNLLD
ncbi:MAG: kinase/pyrophosphorylase [Gammaproteobacteria bacterium]|nr:kinase/pyrophosphorylase [Gammaproteobacteria bacterium]